MHRILVSVSILVMKTLNLHITWKADNLNFKPTLVVGLKLCV